MGFCVFAVGHFKKGQSNNYRECCLAHINLSSNSILLYYIALDVPFQVIQKQPPRQESLENIARHERRLETLMTSKNSLKDKLELRKKQFHLLVQCVHQLQDMLHQEGQEEEEEAGEKEGSQGSKEEPVVMDTS